MYSSQGSIADLTDDADDNICILYYDQMLAALVRVCLLWVQCYFLHLCIWYFPQFLQLLPLTESLSLPLHCCQHNCLYHRLCFCYFCFLVIFHYLFPNYVFAYFRIFYFWHHAMLFALCKVNITDSFYCLFVACLCKTAYHMTVHIHSVH